MKIALAIKELDAARGGAERYGVVLARQLVELGHELCVFAAKWREAPEGATVHRVPTIWRSASLRVRHFARNCAKLIGEGRFDVTLALTQVPGADVYRAGGGLQRFWMRERFPNPLVRWARMAVRPVHAATIALEDRLFAPASNTHIIAVSGLCARQLSEIYGTPAERVTVIHTGTDLAAPEPGQREQAARDVRAELEIAPETPIVLHASNNFGRKGVEAAIRALASPHVHHLSQPPCFVVLGRGDCSRFVSLARKLGVARRVHFLGPRPQIGRYFRAAELLIMMSGYDPFPNAVVESMRSGTPAIVSGNTGAVEIITHGLNGYVIDDWRDWRTLAEVIRGHFSTADRARMSESAVQAVESLTSRANALEVERLLADVARRRRKSSP